MSEEALGALVMHVDCDAWGFLDADERDELCAWVRILGFDPNETKGVRVIGEGMVEVEHFIDPQAGLLDTTRTVVHSGVLPPYIARWEREKVGRDAQPPPVTGG